MMEKIYRTMQEPIQPNEELLAKTIEAAAEMPKRRPILKYTGIAAAAACLVALGSVPVLAANVPAFYEALYRLSPATAHFFTPIQMSCESNGIRFAVEAIRYRPGGSGDTVAEIYLTMTDLTGDRLNMGTDLSGGFALRIEGYDGVTSSTHHYSNQEYDPETKTLRILVEYTFDEGAPAYGDKVTFCMWEMAGGRERTESVIDTVELFEIPLENIAWEHEELKINTFGQNGTNPPMELTAENTKLLQPTMDIPIAEDISLTGAGYLDGHLHMQLHVKDTSLGQQAQLGLVQPNGMKKWNWGHVTGTTDPSGERTHFYQDYIFDISEEELRECQLYGEFYRYSAAVQGKWVVTFTLPEETE